MSIQTYRYPEPWVVPLLILTPCTSTRFTPSFKQHVDTHTQKPPPDVFNDSFSSFGVALALLDDNVSQAVFDDNVYGLGGLSMRSLMTAFSLRVVPDDVLYDAAAANSTSHTCPQQRKQPRPILERKHTRPKQEPPERLPEERDTTKAQ